MKKSTERRVIGIVIFLIVALLVGGQFMGARKGPLLKAVAGADRLELAPVHPTGQPCFFKITGAPQIEELLGLIEIDPLRSRGHCMCRGDTALRFYKGDELLVTIALAHGDHLKWPGGPWTTDGVLKPRSQIAIARWFKEKGYAALEGAR
jgi:hypothetical protein